MDVIKFSPSTLLPYMSILPKLGYKCGGVAAKITGT
jgi:hypothetical protein